MHQPFVASVVSVRFGPLAVIVGLRKFAAIFFKACWLGLARRLACIIGAHPIVMQKLAVHFSSWATIDSSIDLEGKEYSCWCQWGNPKDVARGRPQRSRTVHIPEEL